MNNQREGLQKSVSEIFNGISVPGRVDTVHSESAQKLRDNINRVIDSIMQARE